MSDISNSTSSSSKRRLYQIDETIEYLTQELDTWDDFMYKTEFECCLMTVKMKREKLRALAAAAKSQLLLTNMEVMIAESDLNTDIERLRNFKRRKLNRNQGESQVVAPSPHQVIPPLKTTTVSVQTTESMSNKKKKSRRSSFRKSPDDISSDETVFIPTIQESIASLGDPCQMFHRSLSLGLFTPTPANQSDSEVSLSSSIKAEFNEPYTKTLTQERVKKSPAKKKKCEKKLESKNKSKHVTKLTQSLPGLPKTVADLRKSANIPPNHTDSSSRVLKTVADLRKSANIPPNHTDSSSRVPKTVADLRKSANTPPNQTESSSHAAITPKDTKPSDNKSTACATVTYSPVRHNMGVLVTQPSTSTMSPYLYVNPATQIKTHSQKCGKSQL